MFNYELRFQFLCVTIPSDCGGAKSIISFHLPLKWPLTGLVSWIDGDGSYSNTMLGKPP